MPTSYEFRVTDADRAVGTLLGAAFGDALGWPQEGRARKVGSTIGDGLKFSPWLKRSGGRFMPYTESIASGSYSDDTQLILAVARSRLIGPDWFLHLAQTELPFWPIYERGGGGASLRAARLLQKQTLPWEAGSTDRDKYFRAGGNGVAMRVAPHAVFDRNANDFDHIAVNVMADGVLTHGHPRALVGALVYAYALWTALNSKGTLRFGQLLDAVATNISAWAKIPDISKIWPSWLLSYSTQQFEDSWDQTVGEVRDLFHIISRGLSTGALAVDEETLARLGCFDKSTNGSGTVAAAAAIFLASKHAASPFEGVARAALARGADTDTLASMTGAMMGAINGTDWIQRQSRDVQDTGYIVETALRLHHGAVESKPLRPFSFRQVEPFFRRLEESSERVELPTGDFAVIEPSREVSAASDSVEAASWDLKTSLGQTLVAKRVRKIQNAKAGAVGGKAAHKVAAYMTKPAKFAGITLWVQSLKASRALYCGALGLEISKEHEHLLQLGSHVAIREHETHRAQAGGSVLYLQVYDIEECRRKVEQNVGIITSPINIRSGRKSFALRDHDGHLIEVFQE